MVAVAELHFTDRFVQQMPADPRDDARIRQVMNACYSRVQPTAVPRPELLALIPEVAALLDLDPRPTPELVEVLAGNRVVPGMAPYAACYGGHQFGTWAGQLGDGRAITLGEIENARGETWEMQLKGAGPTPYSRTADGRAVLRSSLRELVCSEAMHHLGVPTTRALSLVATGQPVMRDMLYDGHPAAEPGAVVCRVAPTFLRFGSYEIHTSRDDHATLKKLVDFTLERFYPHHAGNIAAFFEEVMQRTAWMVSEWMRVGFVHGVMNTDNMSILGLTIDYGPYGWLEPFETDWTPNITDASGRRYRFGNQPAVAQWNLSRLGGALAPIAGDLDAIRKTIERYPAEFSGHYRATMLRKLGLRGDHGGDDALLAELAELMTATRPDYTLLFRRLVDPTFDAIREAFYEEPNGVARARWEPWLARYRERDRDVAGMREINPIYVPRNYLVQEVIEATEQGDRARLCELLDVLRHPYDEQPGRERFTRKRPEWARAKPGCSMLSCSS